MNESREVIRPLNLCVCFVIYCNLSLLAVVTSLFVTFKLCMQMYFLSSAHESIGMSSKALKARTHV